MTADSFVIGTAWCSR